MNHNQENIISDNLLVKDQYTLDKIGSYQLLGAIYALDLELHNIGDMRKLDSIKFVQKIESEGKFHECVMLNGENFKLCKTNGNDYLGVSVVSSNNKILGYILARKKYYPAFSSPIIYDLFAILLTVIGIFIFNFGFLFLPIKKKIESNTKLLLKFISPDPNLVNIFHQIGIDEYKIIAQKFIDERNEIEILQKDKTYYEARKSIAEQVAHDIRSPLAALSILTSQDLSLPDQSKILLRNVINRIRDIANDLVDKNSGTRKIITSVDDHSIQLLAVVIYSLITEKRLQFRSESQITIEFELSSESCGLFAKMNSPEFKRMLSNLINNSIEALPGKGLVLIKLSHDNGDIQLIISDNGKGIPRDVLDKLGKCGISYDKKSGSGLGLSHAKNTMEKLGGNLQLMSDLNKGTEVILTFPQAPIPDWFLPKLEIFSHVILVILDDDLSMHQLWEERFRYFEPNIKMINFTSPEKFHEWQVHHAEKPSPILYLFDFEFVGYFQTGLDLIEKYQLEGSSILVTSHFEKNDVRERCEQLGIKIIPKDLAVYVPIKIID